MRRKVDAEAPAGIGHNQPPPEKPWEGIGISRATWYRHGKPTKKHERDSPAKMAALFGATSVRTYQRTMRVRVGAVLGVWSFEGRTSGEDTCRSRTAAAVLDSRRGIAETYGARRRAWGRVMSTDQHAMAAGDLLLEAKLRLKHGEWLPWLAEHRSMSERTAQRYMRLARDLAGRRHIASEAARKGAQLPTAAMCTAHGEGWQHDADVVDEITRWLADGAHAARDRAAAEVPTP
jgi:hypothetical protein